MEPFLYLNEPREALSQFLRSQHLIISKSFTKWPDLFFYLNPEYAYDDLKKIYQQCHQKGYCRCLTKMLQDAKLDHIGLTVFNGCPPFHTLDVYNEKSKPSITINVLHMPDQSLYILDYNFIPHHFQLEQSQFVPPIFSTAPVHNQIKTMPFNKNRKNLFFDRELCRYREAYNGESSFDHFVSRDAFANNTHNKYVCYTRDELRQRHQQMPNRIKLCRLNLVSCHLAHAFPLEVNVRKDYSYISLVGRHNCGRAASGDIVYVELFDRVNANGEQYGQVIGVSLSCLKRKDSLIPCSYNPINLQPMATPIISGLPLLSLDNQQAVKHYEKTQLSQSQLIHTHRDLNGMATEEDKNLIKKEVANLSTICVFDLLTDKKSGFRFNETKGSVIQLPKKRDSYFMLIHYERWSPDRTYPIGKVVRVLEYPQCLGDTIPLLQLYYQMPLPIQSPTKTLVQNILQTQRERNSRRKDFTSLNERTIAIVEENDDNNNNNNNGVTSRECDQAITLYTNIQTKQYEVTFHLAHVSQFISEESPLNKCALKQCCSLKDGSATMIPSDLSINALSFVPNQSRYALSTTFYFTYDHQLIENKNSPQFFPTIIQPRYKLSAKTMHEYCTNFSHRQTLLSSEEAILKQTLEVLRDLGRELHKKSHSGFHVPVNATTFLQPRKEFIFTLMISQFNEFVNERIKTILMNHPIFSEQTPIYAIPSPSEERTLLEFVNRFSQVIARSDLLKYEITNTFGKKYLQPIQSNELLHENDNRQWISHQVLHALNLSTINNETNSTLLLSIEELLPEVTLALHHWRKLKTEAQLTLFDKNEKLDLSLVKVNATHPLQNYIHLFIQRNLTNIIDKKKVNKITKKTLNEMIDEMNHFEMRCHAYEHALLGATLAEQLFYSPLIVQAVVVDINPDTIVLNHPFIQAVSNTWIQDGLTISLASLGIEKSEMTNENEIKLSWISHLHSVQERKIKNRRDDSIVQLNLNENNSICVRKSFSTLPGYQSGQQHYSLESAKSMLTEFKQHISNENNQTNEMDVLAEYDILELRAWKAQMTICPVVSFSCKIKPGDVLTVQYGMANRQKELMNVRAHLLNIVPSFSICLEHNQNPEQCFIRKSSRKLPPFYENMADYFQCQIQVNQRENLERALRDVIISQRLVDVAMQWFCVNETSNSQRLPIGVFFLKKSFIRNRFLSLETYDNNSTEISKMDDLLEHAMGEINSLYYVCLTVPDLVDKSKKKTIANRWVAHGLLNYIAKVDRKSMEMKKYLEKSFDEDDLDDEEVVYAYTIAIVSSLSEGHAQYFNQLCNLELIFNPPAGWSIEKVLGKLALLEEDHLLCQIALNKPLKINHFCDEAATESIFDNLMTLLNNTANLSLNPNQKKAVKTALEKPFSMIFGPPGTGKSTVIACLVLGFFLRNCQLDDNYDAEGDDAKPKRKCILVCAPSNTAADVVAETIFDLFKLIHYKNKIANYKIYRCYGERTHMDDYPIPGIKWKFHDSSHQVSVPPSLKEIAVHLKVYDKDPSWNQRRSQIDSPELAYRFKKEIFDEMQKLTMDADIICTTTISSASGFLKNIDFEQVIVDEAGMCREAETFVPVVNVKNLKNFVLVGDHKQLQPILMSKNKDLGLSVSLFERYSRLHGDNEEICCKLRSQYRMHPSICDFPAQNFYSSVLWTAPSKKWTGLTRDDIHGAYGPFWNGINSQSVMKQPALLPFMELIPEYVWPGCRLPNKQYLLNIGTGHAPPPNIHMHPPRGVKERIVFININNGYEIRNPYGGTNMGPNSVYNPVEADEVMRILRQLVFSELNLKMEFTRKFGEHNKTRFPPLNVAVLSQYRYQTVELEKKVKEIYTKLHSEANINVMSVNSSQGKEWDYVIFSTVRTQPAHNIEKKASLGWQRSFLGFITDANQVNVAITRARKGLIIVGNADLLSLNDTWDKLIKDYKERGCFVNGGNTFWAQ